MLAGLSLFRCKSDPFWLNWTKFDYLYVLFTEDEAPNPAPSRLRLVADGDRFQLYRISHAQ